MSNSTLSWLTYEEIQAIGFLECGEDVLIDRTCKFLGCSRIRLGSHVRIDAFTAIRAGEGGVTIGDHVHLSNNVSISGAGGVVIEDFAGVSGNVSIFSSNDDYSEGWMTNPTVPIEYRKPRSAKVVLQKHSIIGAGSVVLPGVTLGVGASVGALSLVNKSVPDFMIVSGNPIVKVGMRGRKLLQLEEQLRNAEKQSD